MKLGVLLCAVAALMIPSVAADATWPANLIVKNTTDKCAWITAYWANNWTFPWEIVGDRGRPEFLKPHQERSIAFHWREGKIRAEVMKNADCSGGTIADTYDVKKDIAMDTTIVAELIFHSGNRYNLWFK